MFPKNGRVVATAEATATRWGTMFASATIAAGVGGVHSMVAESLPKFNCMFNRADADPHRPQTSGGADGILRWQQAINGGGALRDGTEQQGAMGD